MKFPWVEIGIIISAGSLFGLLTYPQYKNSKKMEKEGMVKFNLHSVQVALEKYAVYNQGMYPMTVKEMEPFFENPGIYPTNPYTQKFLQEEEIQFFLYPYNGDSKDNSQEGVNGQMTGPPGGIGVGIFTIPGDTLVSVETLVPEDTLVKIDSIITEYGLIGFNQDGTPITIYNPAGKDYIFILRN